MDSRVDSDIEDALRAFGYYQSRHQHSFSNGQGCWGLAVSVEPGEPVRVADVEISVIGTPEEQALFSELIASQAPRQGQQLHQGEYESFKSALGALAIEQGFFAARFARSEIALSTSQNEADIVLAFQLNERYRFGELNIVNHTRLNDSLIAQMISIKEGDDYSSAALYEQRETLNGSQFFNGITLYPELGSADGEQIPLNMQLEPRPRHVYSTGIGYTTDTGPRLRLGYEDRYVNSRGHSVRTSTSLSQVRQEVNLAYRIPPLWDPIRENLQIRGGYLSEETDTYENEIYTVGVNYRKELDNGWLRDAYISFQEEEYSVEDDANNSTLAMLGLSFTRSRSDSPVFARRGWYLFADVRGAHDSVISDTSFVQLNALGRYIFSIGDVRFLSRLELGTTFMDDAQDLPASIRFFTGGDQSVRGYKYQTLGPENEAGEVVGGKHLIQASVEADFPIYGENWRMAFFYDTGNAFNDLDNYDMKHSVGMGLRWISPIGPVRIDVGHPLNDGGVRLHITMGPDL